MHPSEGQKMGPIIKPKAYIETTLQGNYTSNFCFAFRFFPFPWIILLCQTYYIFVSESMHSKGMA